MSSALDADPIVLAVGPAGLHGQWLPGAIALGTSMLPFFEPQDEIWNEPVQAAAVRVGNVITFSIGPNQLVTHRVVKILRRDGEPAFLTKGDNRPTFDPVVLPRQMIGMVVRAGRKDLTGPGWRRGGAFIAWVSYGQGRIHQWLSGGWLNRLRHALERKGWCPKIRLLDWYRVLINPLGCLTWARGVAKSHETGRRRAAFLRQGIRVRPWAAGDVGPMSQIWNASFPTHPTTAERLYRMVCRSPWFDPSGCFVLKRGGDFLGWAFSSLHLDGPQPARKRHSGFLEFLTLTEAGWKLQGDGLLFHESLAWLKKRGVSEISLGPLLTERNRFGIALTPALAAAAVEGFTLSHRSDEQVVTRREYRLPVADRSAQELTIRPLQSSQENLAALDDFFRRNGFGHLGSAVQEHLAREGGENHFRVAVLRGQPVGFCRLLLDFQIKDYRDLGHVWSATQPKVPAGYLSHLLVDKGHRSQGIGPALVVQAVETFFKVGCEEINLWSVRSKFYQRLGFVKRGQFVRMRLQL